MADEQIHQDLGVDLGGGGRAPMNATEAAVRRSTTEQQEMPKYVSEADRRAAEKDAKMSPGEKRRMEITRELASGTLDDVTRAARLRELKASLAAEDDDDVKAARADASLVERRQEYGVEDPKLPTPWLEQYYAEYAGWEAPLFDVAHEHGLAVAQVRGLRDAAIELGQIVGERRTPATEDELNRALDRLEIGADQRAALVKLWRQVEGTPS